MIKDIELPEGQSLYGDMFLIGIYTGLCVSDAIILKSEQISGKRIIKSMQKVSSKVYVPLVEPAIQILDRYKGGKMCFQK